MRGPDSCCNCLANAGLMRGRNGGRAGQELAVKIAQVGYGGEEGFLWWGED